MPKRECSQNEYACAVRWQSFCYMLQWTIRAPWSVGSSPWLAALHFLLHNIAQRHTRIKP